MWSCQRQGAKLVLDVAAVEAIVIVNALAREAVAEKLPPLREKRRLGYGVLAPIKPEQSQE